MNHKRFLQLIKAVEEGSRELYASTSELKHQVVSEAAVIFESFVFLICDLKQI